MRTALVQLLLIVLFCIHGTTLGQETQTQPSFGNESLRKELLSLEQREQDARKEMLARLGEAGVSMTGGKPISDPKILEIIKTETEKLTKIDASNQTRLKEILKTYGWPGKSIVGEDGAHAAWIIAQHADNDPAFQRECLSLMKESPKGEVTGKSFAYLTDRILVGEKKAQRYGTQLGPNFVPLPIEDEELVDARRADLGLQPLSEYIEYAKAEYAKLTMPAENKGK
jgi:hypothetical protein